jgi:hypothetical protein
MSDVHLPQDASGNRHFHVTDREWAELVAKSRTVITEVAATRQDIRHHFATYQDRARALGAATALGCQTQTDFIAESRACCRAA